MTQADRIVFFSYRIVFFPVRRWLRRVAILVNAPAKTPTKRARGEKKTIPQDQKDDTTASAWARHRAPSLRLSLSGRIPVPECYLISIKCVTPEYFEAILSAFHCRRGSPSRANIRTNELVPHKDDSSQKKTFSGLAA